MIKVQGTYLEGCCGGECSCNAEKKTVFELLSFEDLRERLWETNRFIEVQSFDEWREMLWEWREMLWRLWDACESCLTVGALDYASEILKMLEHEIELARQP